MDDSKTSPVKTTISNQLGMEMYSLPKLQVQEIPKTFGRNLQKSNELHVKDLLNKLNFKLAQPSLYMAPELIRQVEKHSENYTSW